MGASVRRRIETKLPRRRSTSRERSSRFHNAARALFSSYVVPFSRRLVSSPFSRSSVGQRTFSPAAFQRAASASNFSMRRGAERRDGGHSREDLSIRRQDAGTFSTCPRRTAPRPRFRNSLEKLARPMQAELAKKRAFLYGGLSRTRRHRAHVRLAILRVLTRLLV